MGLVKPPEETPLLPDARRRRKRAKWGVRHVQALLLFLCTSTAYSLRVNLSVAIVAMVNQTASGNKDFPVFDWKKKTQSVVLSSFFWGYLVMQIPASQLAQRFGARFFLAGAMVGTGLFTMLLPVAAIFGDWPAVAVTRAASGLCQGFVFPACYVLLGKWAPPLERGRFTAFVIGAQLLGPVVMLPVTGVLSSSAGGWPSVFYASGALGLLVGVLVFIFVADSPAEHKHISEVERDYIQRSIGGSMRNQLKRTRTPWLSIITCVPLWATMISHAGQSWGFLTFITEVPTYMSSVLKFDIKKNGLLSALPYLTTWFASFAFSWLSDFITERKMLTLTASRKIFNTIGMWGPGLTMLGVGYISDSPPLAVTLLTVALGLKAGCYVGFQVNYVDLAPQFSGTSFSLGNFLANSCSTLAPIAVGLIVTDQTSIEQWRYVFFVTCAMFFLGNLVFICFGSAEVQPWNGSRKASMYLSKDSIASQDLERLRAAAAT
ncbi:putative inorganic phosphate cotransporter isoform X2 [Thrips palmi]|uniref:Putative inorganic phosphate cotransporter n=1 Tax=Thrips palmi TaxID=161013 RepID=A0A6P9AC02_THRPL|nr:putative inorganic phosphate cotransporter isoform X2 [Thrips palmi]